LCWPELRLDPNALQSYSTIVTTRSDIPVKGGGFLSEHRKLFHLAVLLTISLCVLEHLVECLIGWDTFLLTGKDTETLLFFVFLLVGLAFSLAALIRISTRLSRSLGTPLTILKAEIPPALFALAIRPDASPPPSLRI
jgi:hypothetical protein